MDWKLAERFIGRADNMGAANARRCTIVIIKKLLSASSDGFVRLFKINQQGKLELALLKEFKEKQCTLIKIQSITLPLNSYQTSSFWPVALQPHVSISGTCKASSAKNTFIKVKKARNTPQFRPTR